MAKIPHFYQNIAGYMDEKNQVLFDLVIQDIKKESVWVELGSWTGKSAAYCIVELINNGKLNEFYCVDSWKGGEEHQHNEMITSDTLYNIFVQNLAPVADNFRTIQGLSWDAAKNFSDSSVDFLYVDAGHSYFDVMNDLQAWWPKIRQGSYFGGDDFTKKFPGVQKAVFDFFDPLQIRVKRLGRCWYVVKT